jgi:hypothetical protein
MKISIIILTILSLNLLFAGKEVTQIVYPQITVPIGISNSLEGYHPARQVSCDVEAQAEFHSEVNSVHFLWGSDILIDSSLIFDFDGDYDEDNGWMWVAVAPLIDSVIRLYRSTDHGLTWTNPYTFWHTTRSLYSKVGVVVGRGDSNYVYIFARHSGLNNSGDIAVIRVKFDLSGWDANWMTWDADTIDDFTVCRDYRSNYNLYCHEANERRGGQNALFHRSTDLGRNWDAQPGGDMWDTHISAGATNFINLAFVVAETRNSVIYQANNNYGAPGHWGYTAYVSFDTFDHYRPKVAAAFTTPDSQATTWVLYEYDWANRGDLDVHYAIRSHAWADTWRNGFHLAWQGDFDEAAPDIKNYKSLGNPYVNAVYIAADSSWEDSVNTYYEWTAANNPSTWSGLTRVNDDATFVGYWFAGGSEPKIIYSPGAPASGGGVLYCRAGIFFIPHGLYFDAPWIGINEKMNDKKISKLLQIEPNPFRNKSVIKYSVPSMSKVELKIFDISGREVKSLFNGQLPNGNYSASWDGTDNVGKKQGNGIYLLKLKIENLETVEKLILTK